MRKRPQATRSANKSLPANSDLFQYQNASAIILAIFVIVLVMEFVTDRLRALIQ